MIEGRVTASVYSGMGVASFVLSAVGILLFVVAYLAAEYIKHKYTLLGPPGFEDPGFELLVALLVLLTASCNLAALGFRTVILLGQGRRLFALLDVVCSILAMNIACVLLFS